MRLTLEKVLILKDIPLFADLPEAALSDIISASEETAAMIGTDIVKEGDEWNDLYIILQGQVRVHKNGQTVREYNALTTFGELAALDAETARETFTALEDTTLFKVSGPALYRLMNEHKSLEKNMFKMLCRRLRSAYQQ
ncbi:MAG: cyclic nucleotide-binding domain-containing protein [Alphaproteobacteria bacterium]|nr:cyclic nucleotide-binding domain-containing protein [Alphaproteobacteria bacterium]MBO4643718.1 cyclic nucleotide-binding domain-containing protein [Alphaproteobacteria bacterium]